MSSDASTKQHLQAFFLPNGTTSSMAGQSTLMFSSALSTMSELLKRIEVVLKITNLSLETVIWLRKSNSIGNELQSSQSWRKQYDSLSHIVRKDSANMQSTYMTTLPSRMRQHMEESSNSTKLSEPRLEGGKDCCSLTLISSGNLNMLSSILMELNLPPGLVKAETNLNKRHNQKITHQGQPTMTFVDASTPQMNVNSSPQPVDTGTHAVSVKEPTLLLTVQDKSQSKVTQEM